MQGRRGNDEETLDMSVDIFEQMQATAAHMNSVERWSHGGISRSWNKNSVLYVEYEDGAVFGYTRDSDGDYVWK